MQIILKGVNTLISEDELLLKLKKSFETNESLTIKLGLDPSAPDIHLGHAVVLRKIKQMQDLGHRAVIIIGDGSSPNLIVSDSFVSKDFLSFKSNSSSLIRVFTPFRIICICSSGFNILTSP